MMRLSDALAWSFGPPKVTRCNRTGGSHAQLPVCEIPVLYKVLEVMRVNVHMHHHAAALSVGVTMHLPFPAQPAIDPEPSSITGTP